MNLENREPSKIEPKNQPQDMIPFSSNSNGITQPIHAKKPRGFINPLLAIGGVALCLSVTSCVVPYDSNNGGSSVSVTRYSPGYRVTSLPGGYRSEIISGSTYYYHDGYYYRRGDSGYVVVDAPRRSRYYDDYGRYQQTYQPSRDYRDSSNNRDYRNSPNNREYRESYNRNDSGYDRTQVITRLPSGYRELNHRGSTYYQAGDQYYRRQGDSYIITTRPY